MSYDERAGLALAGEFSAMNLLKLLGMKSPQKAQKTKYTGSRKALREMMKARREKEQSK